MKRDQLTNVLLERFPQIRPAVDARTDWQPTAGSHAIFANVFTPYVVQLLGADGEELRITEAFAFIEELAGDREPGIQEVVSESVLEVILHDSEALRLAWPHMKETTRRIVWALAEAGGFTRSIPSGAV